MTVASLRSGPVKGRTRELALGNNQADTCWVCVPVCDASMEAVRFLSYYSVAPLGPEDLGIADVATNFEDLARLVEIVDDLRQREGVCPKVDEAVELIRASASALDPLGEKLVGPTTYAEFKREIEYKIRFHDFDSESPAGSATLWCAGEQDVKRIVSKLREFHDRAAVIAKGVHGQAQKDKVGELGAKPPVLNGMERNIIEALGTAVMKGSDLAERSGYDYNSVLKQTLASLVRQGILGKDRKKGGYFLQSKYLCLIESTGQSQDQE